MQKEMGVAVLFGMSTMVYCGIFFSLYDRFVRGFVNENYFLQISLVGFAAGFFAYISKLAIGMR